MSIGVSCKTCWYDFSVRNDTGGKVTYCPNCGSRIILDVERTLTDQRLSPIGMGARDWRGRPARALNGHTVVHQFP